MGMEDGLAAALRVGVPVEQAEVIPYALVLLAALLTVVFRPAARISVIVVYLLYSPLSPAEQQTCPAFRCLKSFSLTPAATDVCCRENRLIRYNQFNY